MFNRNPNPCRRSYIDGNQIYPGYRYMGTMTIDYPLRPADIQIAGVASENIMLHLKAGAETESDEVGWGDYTQIFFWEIAEAHQRGCGRSGIAVCTFIYSEIHGFIEKGAEAPFSTECDRSRIY